MRNIHHESTGMHVRNVCAETARNIPYKVINFVLLQATLKSPTPIETLISHQEVSKFCASWSEGSQFHC